MADHLETVRRPNLDTVTTINTDGSHNVLHPADVKGRFTLARRLVAFVLILVYTALPWIPINGAPAVFFDVEMRRFHLFGLTMVAQDMWVLFFAISGLGFLLFVITSVLGRIWCGWACPYTVFLDHVFRRIERLIDGDASARRKLAAAPNDFTKITKRVIKHGLYIVCSALIAHIFLSYFVSLPRLYSFMRQGPVAHPTSFGVVLFLTGTLYYCYAHFREQFCILMCPYGRLQSALTDDDTMIIGYDLKRGEPRGKVTDPNAGACIDCNRCVTVCPTGIDIRAGLQMECIGCAACIDACDDIMTKVKRPTGLIRYDSSRGLAGEKRRIFRPRLLAYGFLGLLGLTALGVTAFMRAKPMNADVTRMRGPSFYRDPTMVRNHYQLRLFNKRNQAMTFNVSLENPPPGFALTGIGGDLKLDALKELARPLVVIVPNENYQGPRTLTLKIHSQPGDSTVRHEIEFLGPNPHLFKQP
ncbi:MAG: cytochrome c oxidase accessory protein CcoG [Verrucomicrobiota bacterium]